MVLIKFKGGEYEWFQEVMCWDYPSAKEFGPFELVGLCADGNALVMDDGIIKSFEFITPTSKKPKLVPFTQETFPKAQVWARAKGKSCTSFVGFVGFLGITGVIIGGTATVSYVDLLAYYEISINNRHTWVAAGIEE